MINLNNISAYDYDLPQNLIAQNPSTPPDSCGLLFADVNNQTIEDKIFYELPDLVPNNALMFVNNSKVIKARLKLKNTEIITDTGTSKTITEGEILFLRMVGGNNVGEGNHGNQNEFEALVFPGKKLKTGSKIIFDKEIVFTIKKQTPEGRIIYYDGNILEVLEKYGQMPLPPYISYDETKESPYQPIFAQKPGSVASPTASLHFTSKTFDDLANKNVDIHNTTLHIGLGTFKIVDVQNIKEYDIHTEQVEIDMDIFDIIDQAKSGGNHIMGVGTTVTRTLESLPYLRTELKNKGLLDKSLKFWDDISTGLSGAEIIKNLNIVGDKIIFDTKLYIYPGFKFKIIQSLLTNFHLPKSSLLMMIAAFMGYDFMRRVYTHAIEFKYRFYSFGDACYILT